MSELRKPLTFRDHSRTLRAEIWARRRDFLLGLLATFLSAGVSLLIPARMQTLVSETLPSGNFSAVAKALGIILFIAAVSIGLSALRKYLMERLSHNITTDMRTRLFGHVLSISPQELQRTERGQILSTFSNDLQVFSDSTKTLVSVVIPSAIFVSIYSAAALWYSWPLFFVLIGLMGPMILGLDRLVRLIHAASAKAQAKLGELIGELNESLAGIKEIKLFGIEDQVLDRFSVGNRETRQVLLQRDKLSTFFPFLISMIAAVGIAAIILISLFLLNRGWLDIAALTGFTVCMGLLYGPLQDLGNAFGQAMQLFAVLGRIEGIWQLTPEADTKSPENAKVRGGSVVFEDISFAYPGNPPSIHSLSLKIEEGQTIALVGPSGAGKSTLLEFLPRFLEPSSGRILIGDTDIATLPLLALRAQIGLVTQVPFLFRGTLHENLTVGAQDASPARVKEVADIARVDEFVERMAEGYDTIIEPGGTNLSVGQRQRIAIARVLLKDPPILLLDEPTSALDSASERLVSDAIQRATEGRTTIIVAHRLSTVNHVDRVIVMHSGEVVEDGTHAELMKKNGLFAELAASAALAEQKG